MGKPKINREEVKKLHSLGLNNKQITEKINCCTGTISKILKELNLNSNHKYYVNFNVKQGDNRIENLELWVSNQPPGQRVEDLVKYSIELLEKYGEYNEKTRGDINAWATRFREIKMG